VEVFLVLGADLQNDPYRDIYAVFATETEAQAWVSEKGEPWYKIDRWTVGHDLDAKYASDRPE
jgi:hypothetical protein